jgi:hypothetical protein
MALSSTMATGALQEFIGAVERAHLDAPWTGPVMSHEPKSRVLPFTGVGRPRAVDQTNGRIGDPRPWR